MTEGRNRIVDYLARTIDPAQRPVRRQAVPGRERQILAKVALRFAVEFLLRDAYGGDLAERRF